MQKKDWARGMLAVVAITSCGGNMQVGMEEESAAGASSAAPEGSSAGTPSSEGSEPGSGEASEASSGGAASSGDAGLAGSNSEGEGGAGPVVGQCGFSPDTPEASAEPFASKALVSGRITRFLQNAITEPGPDLEEASAAWASERVLEILDTAVAQGIAPDGLELFLETWLDVSREDVGAGPLGDFYAESWAATLATPDATLTTLFTEPTDDPERSGILTDAQLLAARGGITSRGAWLYESLFCLAAPLPPIGAPAPDEQLMDETRREWLARQVAPAQCGSCHAVLDPVAWSLEHFDETGVYSEVDNGQPVDSSGTLVTPQQEELTFTSIDDLAPQLATSCEVAQCFARSLMNHAFAVTDPMAVPYSEAELNRVANRFAESSFSIRELITAIVETPSFLR